MNCETFPVTRSELILSVDNTTVSTRNQVQNTNHQQMHKEGFIINRNTLQHVSTLLGHLQGELFCYGYTKVALYS
jgi:hypothetical protein